MSELSSLTAPTLPPLRLKGAAGALFDSREGEVLIEGPAGTGKTLGCLVKCVSVCEETPGARVLVARATRVSLSESVLVTLERELLVPGHPARIGSDAGRGNRRSYVWPQPHGSELVVGGLDNTERIMSSEYDLVYVAEATETAEEDWERLLTRLRNKKHPYQQAIADCNPTAPGHWLNKRAAGGQMQRLLSRHRDNPSLDAEYMGRLAGLTGHRRARLFEGRWVSAEGSVFGSEFEDGRNIVPDFDPPDDWPLWPCIDPGYDHPCAVTFNTVSPNGHRYTVYEVYTRQSSIAEIAGKIKEQLRGRSPTAVLLDPRHGFMRTAQSPTTIAEQFAKEGIKCAPWPAVAGSVLDASVNAHRKVLTSGLYKVCRRCVNTIAEHQSWSYKRTSSGELPVGDDQYEDKDNHCLDTIMGWERTNPQHVPSQLGYIPGAATVMQSGVKPNRTLEIMKEMGEW